MSEQDNKEVIQRGYAAFASGDVETVMSLFDDDIEWVQPGDSTVSGTFHGKTELIDAAFRAEVAACIKSKGKLEPLIDQRAYVEDMIANMDYP
jgi:ketosteroid isomerase-like protein